MSVPSWAQLWFEVGFRRTHDGGAWIKKNPDTGLKFEVRPIDSGYRVRAEKTDDASTPMWVAPRDRFRVETYATSEEAFAAYTGWLLSGILPEPELWPKRPRG